MEFSQTAADHTNVRLQDVLLVLWRRSWVIALILATSLGTAAYVTKYASKRWKATAQVILVQRNAPIVTGSSGMTYQGTMIDTTDTQVAMLQSQAMSRRTIDWLKNEALSKGKSPDSIGIRAEDLQKSLTATSPKETNLIDITVEASARQQGIHLADAVSKAFVQWKKEVAQQNFEETQTSLEDRLKRAAAQLASAERNELEFKRTRQMVDVPARQSELIGRAQSRETEVQQLTQALSAQKENLGRLAQNLRIANSAITQLGPSSRNDLIVNTYQANLSDLEAKRAELKQHFNDNHPDVVAVNKQVKETRDKLAAAIRSALDDKRPTLAAQASYLETYKDAQVQIHFDEAKLTAAVHSRDQAKAQLVGIPSMSTQYAHLAEATATARALNNSIQTALNVVRVNRDMASGNIQIAQFGDAPEKAFKPNHLQDMLLGAGVGVLLAFVAVLLLEQSDRRVRSVENVREIVAGPIIGALPRMPRAQIAGALDGKTSASLEETYSLARANLSLVLRGFGQKDISDHQVLLVTSSVPGEGKSITAANLARSIARSGKSVVLVDADMRRPTQNRFFGTDEPHGLADVLAGKMTLDETLVSSSTENLLLLHSGVPSRNPTELISALTMTQLMQDLREEAEVIIIDTPACSVVADALLLAPHADCILHVIGVGSADESLLRSAIQNLSAADPKAMVFFLNRIGKSRGYHRYYDSYTAPRNGANGSGNGVGGRNRHADAAHANADLPRLN